MKYGIDYLAGARYGEVILKTHPDGWAAGFFSYVDGFGSSLGVAKKLLKTGKCQFIRFQLWWEDDHDFNGKDEKILEQSREVKKLAQEFPKIQFEVSPACEHKLSNPDSLLDKVAKVYEGMKNVEIVNTPWIKGGGRISNKYKNEVHRDDNMLPPRGKFNFSYDGINCFDSDVSQDKTIYKKADVFFFWCYQLNLLRNDKSPRPPRDKRDVRPTKELLESIHFLATNKGKTSINKGDLAKSHAEDIKGLNRSNKLMLILAEKADAVHLVKGNQTVASAKWAGKHEGKNRYYFEKWGYKLAKEHGLLKIIANGKTLGIINAGFREGYFR